MGSPVPRPSIFFVLANEIYTFIVFVCFVLSTPFLCWFYVYVKICRFLWLLALSYRYPHLELVRHLSMRSVVDTYRCQGIISVLLQIGGKCDVNLVKQKIIEDVIEKKNKDGKLRFPHMKKKLTSCWGRYAWHRDDSEFNVENHVIHVENPILRNRVVTSQNIREFVSKAIAKYLPPWNNPPWQVMLITTEPDTFYILARVHHLYISEDGISFGHLLMVDKDEQWVQPISNPEDLDSIDTILKTVLRKPKYIPQLWRNISNLVRKIRRFFADKWSGLMDAYDPEKNPYFSKHPPNILQFFMICWATIMATIDEYYRADEPVSFSTLLMNQIKRRQISPMLFLRCFLTTLYNPLDTIKIIVDWYLMVLMKCIYFLPIALLNILFHFVLLLLRCTGEIIYVFHLIYTAPRVILDDVFIPMFHSPKHHLQTVSLSGRKQVHWTEPIPVQEIRHIQKKTGVASCEIQLYCVSAALQHYLQKYNYAKTDDILTTTRFVPQEQLLMSSNRISSGLLCLSLPMNLPEDDSLYGLHMMQISLQDALAIQAPLYLASLSQYDYGVLTKVFPSIVSRIVFYVLSTRYSVMLTQVEPHDKEMKKTRLIWGQQVESFVYWRPPQANVSLSMTLINYGDEIRFAVMADAELAPQFKDIVDQFATCLRKLSVEAENYVPQ